jgi:ABC-type polysaccharide/polyol phosphate transport system ATPase subunit
VSASVNDEPFIRLESVSLEFQLHQYRTDTLKEWFVDAVRRRRARARSFMALRDVSLDLRAGARLGVIGPNGAGKSLLLKLMAGVYAPTRGVVATRGDIAALLELGVGLDDELTGRENIYLFSALLGRGPRETRARVASILDFAGVGDFADVPLKYYSSGMRLRLAFAAATDGRPHVLLLDEVFSCGDADFVARAGERMRSLVREASILVLVSHDMALLQEHCDSAVVVRGGAVSPPMPVPAAVERYLHGDPAERASAAAPAPDLARWAR